MHHRISDEIGSIARKGESKRMKSGFLLPCPLQRLQQMMLPIFRDGSSHLQRYGLKVALPTSKTQIRAAEMAQRLRPLGALP